MATMLLFICIIPMVSTTSMAWSHSGIPVMTPEDLQQDFEDDTSVFTILVYGETNFSWVTITNYTLW